MHIEVSLARPPLSIYKFLHTSTKRLKNDSKNEYRKTISSIFVKCPDRLIITMTAKPYMFSLVSRKFLAMRNITLYSVGNWLQFRTTLCLILIHRCSKMTSRLAIQDIPESFDVTFDLPLIRAIEVCSCMPSNFLQFLFLLFAWIEGDIFIIIKCSFPSAHARTRAYRRTTVAQKVHASMEPQSHLAKPP